MDSTNGGATEARPNRQSRLGTPVTDWAQVLPKKWPARYTLVCLMFITYMIGWSDRVNLSVSVPVIQKEFGWSKTEMGVILSAFTWGFVIFKLPAGWLADKFGGLRTMTWGLFTWSLATLFTPFAASKWGLFTMRLLLGIGEITYPASQVAVITKYYPKTERSKVNGICLSASDVGSMLATPLAAWLLVLYGWRPLFYILGLVSILWAFVFYFWWKRLYQELQSSKFEDPTRQPTIDKRPISWLGLLRLPSVWGLTLAYISLTYCYWFFLHWMPTYLVEERGFTILEMGFYAIAPYIGQGVFQILAGWVSASLISRGFSLNFSRKIIIYVGFLGGSLFMLIAGHTSSALLAVVFISLSIYFLASCWTSIWTIPSDMSSRHPAMIFGFAGSIGFLGSITAPIVTGYIVDTTGQWFYAFGIAAAMAFVGFVVTALLVSTDSIDEHLTAAAA